jgi:hypothetical protein
MFLAVLVSPMQYFIPFVGNIEVKTINFGTCYYSFSYNLVLTLTFIEIYRFIDRNFSKKTINFVFIVLSKFFEKDTLYIKLWGCQIILERFFNFANL